MEENIDYVSVQLSDLKTLNQIITTLSLDIGYNVISRSLLFDTAFKSTPVEKRRIIPRECIDLYYQFEVKPEFKGSDYRQEALYRIRWAIFNRTLNFKAVVTKNNLANSIGQGDNHYVLCYASKKGDYTYFAVLKPDRTISTIQGVEDFYYYSQNHKVLGLTVRRYGKDTISYRLYKQKGIKFIRELEYSRRKGRDVVKDEAYNMLTGQDLVNSIVSFQAQRKRKDGRDVWYGHDNISLTDYI